MTKKLILRLALLAVIIFSVHSCRTEDDVAQNTKEPQNKFAAFSQNGNEKVNYPKAFDYLYNRYYELRDISVKNRSTAGDSPYTDFRFHSQLMEADNGDKAMLFPVIKGNKVIGLMTGLLEKEETYLRYYEVAAAYDQYSFAVSSFQKLVDKYSGVNSRNIYGDGGDHTDIPEIIVSPPRGGGGMTIGFPPISGGCTACPPDEGSPLGECPKYGGCSSSGGGTGNTPPVSTKDPCEKLKNQTLNPNFKAKINTLESNLDKKKETGYVEKTNGSFEYKDNASATEDTNSLTLGDPTPDMKGYMHTHPNDFEDSEGNMRIGFKIFSPADVIYFNQMISNAQANGTPLDDIYAVMVSGKGNYQIRFTGNANQIKTTYTNTKTEYREMYKKYFEKYKDRSDEMNFLKFMDEKMYVKGVSLVKIEKDGTITKKTLNTDKSGVTNSPCS